MPTLTRRTAVPSDCGLMVTNIDLSSVCALWQLQLHSHAFTKWADLSGLPGTWDSLLSASQLVSADASIRQYRNQVNRASQWVELYRITAKVDTTALGSPQEWWGMHRRGNSKSGLSRNGKII